MQSEQTATQPQNTIPPHDKGASLQDVHNAVKALALAMKTQEAES